MSKVREEMDDEKKRGVSLYFLIALILGVLYVSKIREIDKTIQYR